MLSDVMKIMPWRRAMPAVLFGVFAGIAGMASASPERGGQCTACHQSSTAMPAAHPPIGAMESAQCLTCHQISSRADPVAPAGAVMSSVTDQQVQDQMQTSEQDREQHQGREQEQDRDQQRTQSQLMIGNSGDTRQEHRGQESDGHGHQAHDAEAQPLSFRLTFGVLSSDNISQHRSNSIFHGSGDASFYQPGASGGSGDHGGGGNGGEGHEGDDHATDQAATDETETGGNRIHMGLRANYDVGLEDGSTLTYGVRINRDAFLDEDFNRTSARLSARWRTRYEQDMLQLTTYYQRTLFDGTAEDLESDFGELGLNLNYHRGLSGGRTLLAALRARQRDYEEETSARRADYSMSLGLQTALGDDATLRYGLTYISRNNPKRDQSRYDSPSLFASYERSVSDTMTLGVSGEFGQRNYRAPDQATDITRQDRFGEIGFSVSDSRLRILSATPEFSCSYNRTSSNLDQFDSDGTYCGVMLERRF